MKHNIKIMIAGGCGFIGSSLANFFLHKYPSSKIYILDNLMRLGSEINLKRLRSDRLIFLKGDLSYKTSFDNLPICDVFIKRRGRMKHLIHVRDLRHVPTSNVLIKVEPFIKHSAHARHLRSVPFRNIAVEA